MNKTLGLVVFLLAIPAMGQTKGTPNKTPFQGSWLGIACAGEIPVGISITVDNDVATLHGVLTPTILRLSVDNRQAAAYIVIDQDTFLEVDFPNKDKVTLELELQAYEDKNIGGIATLKTPGQKDMDMLVSFTSADQDFEDFYQDNQDSCKTEKPPAKKDKKEVIASYEQSSPKSL